MIMFTLTPGRPSSQREDWSGHLARAGHRITTEFLQIVKFPDLGAEEVNNDIPTVDQNPISLAHALNSRS